MKKQKKNTSGCLWIFVFAILSFFSWVFISLIIDISAVVSAIIALIIGALLASKWLGRPTLKSLVTNSVVLIILLLALRFLSQFFVQTVTVLSEENNFKKEEGVALTKIIEDNDSITVFESH